MLLPKKNIFNGCVLIGYLSWTLETMILSILKEKRIVVNVTMHLKFLKPTIHFYSKIWSLKIDVYDLKFRLN